MAAFYASETGEQVPVQWDRFDLTMRRSDEVEWLVATEGLLFNPARFAAGLLRAHMAVDLNRLAIVDQARFTRHVVTAQLSPKPSVTEWLDSARRPQAKATLPKVQHRRVSEAWAAADRWLRAVEQDGRHRLDDLLSELPGYEDELLRLHRPGYDFLTFTLGEVAMLLTRIDLDEDVLNCRDEESGFNAASAVAEQEPRMIDVHDPSAPLLSREARQRLTTQSELSLEQRAVVPHPEPGYWRLMAYMSSYPVPATRNHRALRDLRQNYWAADEAPDPIEKWSALMAQQDSLYRCAPLPKT